MGLFVSQETLCCHVRAAAACKENSESPQPRTDIGPIDIVPVDSHTYKNVFYLSPYASPESQLSHTSTSPGRAPIHMFLVMGMRPCFVKIFTNKKTGASYIRCHSSKGKHVGKQSTCCQKIFKMLTEVTDIGNLFQNLQDPSAYSSSRGAGIEKSVFEIEDLWPYDEPNHIMIGTWKNGRFQNDEFPEECGVQHLHIKPKCPGPGWILRRDRGPRRTCTLIGPQRALKGVWIMEWYNPQTQETVRVGPSCGIFIATGPKCNKRDFAYDAHILYTAIHNIIEKQSSIQMEYEDLQRIHKARALNDKLSPSPLPTLAQFSTHLHRFIQSQVMLDTCPCKQVQQYACHSYMHTYMHDIPSLFCDMGTHRCT